MIRLALLSCLVVGPVDLEELSRSADFDWTSDSGTGRHTIRARGLQLAFVPGIDTAIVNGAPQRLSTPVTVDGGRLKVPPEIAALIRRHAELPPLAKVDRKAPAPPAPPKAERRMPACKIVIDPGHGGIHTGFKGRGGLLEKDINLDVSLELRRLLASWGAEVVLTRDADGQFSADIDEDLAARVEIVNRARPDLFVSVHTNGVPNPGPRGFEVWVPLAADARGAASRHLAQLVLGELEGVWASDNRGVKDEHHLRVLKNTRCPSVLVEMEFVSNPQAERDLSRSAKRAEVAQAIAEAVRKWAASRKR